MKEIIEEKYVTVKEDVKRSVLMVSWFGGCSSEQYKEVMLQAVEYAVENGLKYWLTDNREAHLLRLQDQQWLIDELIPKVKNSFKKIGVVDSADVFRNVNVSIIQRATQSFTFKIKNFASLEEAFEWFG